MRQTHAPVGGLRVAVATGAPQRNRPPGRMAMASRRAKSCHQSGQNDSRVIEAPCIAGRQCVAAGHSSSLRQPCQAHALCEPRKILGPIRSDPVLEVGNAQVRIEAPRASKGHPAKTDDSLRRGKVRCSRGQCRHKPGRSGRPLRSSRPTGDLWRPGLCQHVNLAVASASA
jgi:hypothetical protein